MEAEIVEKKEEGTSYKQVSRLANFIMRRIEGEPSKSEGAVDTAIRLLKESPKYKKPVEKKKTLSDNIYCRQDYKDMFAEEDVKEKLKEFIDKVSRNTAEEYRIKLIAKELFGEKLIQNEN